jgi:hypothetical protein
MIEGLNTVSQCKECVFELSEVRREASRRAHQNNSQTREEISRWLSSLERKTMWEETQCRVTEYSVTLYQEGIEKVQERTRTTHYKVLESLREPKIC